MADPAKKAAMKRAIDKAQNADRVIKDNLRGDNLNLTNAQLDVLRAMVICGYMDMKEKFHMAKNGRVVTIMREAMHDFGCWDMDLHRRYRELMLPLAILDDQEQAKNDD